MKGALTSLVDRILLWQPCDLEWSSFESPSKWRENDESKRDALDVPFGSVPRDRSFIDIIENVRTKFALHHRSDQRLHGLLRHAWEASQSYEFFQLIVQLLLVGVQIFDGVRSIRGTRVASVHFEVSDTRIFLAQLGEDFLLSRKRSSWSTE